jgi:hypothetical protein
MDGLTRNFGNRKATTSMIAWQEELRDILPKYLDLLENSEK